MIRLFNCLRARSDVRDAAEERRMRLADIEALLREIAAHRATDDSWTKPDQPDPDPAAPAWTPKLAS